MTRASMTAVRAEPNVTPMIDVMLVLLIIVIMAVDTATLRRRLEARFREHPNDRVIFLRADESLPFEELQNTMALASSAGATVVGLVSRPPSSKE